MVRILIVSILLACPHPNAFGANCESDAQIADNIQSQKIIKNALVVDSVNQLMWTQCTLGKSGSLCVDGSAIAITWVEALNKARGLEFGGFTNWRMPRVEELITIVDPCAESPKVIKEFVGFPEGLVWTSSANIDYATDAWAVDFSTGEAVISSRDEPRYVIFVRGLD